MKRLTLALAGVATGALAVSACAADAPVSSSEIVVTGIAAPQQTSSATGLPLTVIETPQAVSIVGQQQIKTFALTDVNALLDQVPAVNVERNETDRSEYDSRGFQITNFQVDGIGLPLIDGGIQYGALDTALWDRVESIRGANGMMTGIGNPSATINYVRKRPTAEFEASITGTLGSFDDHRIEGDISGPLNANGTIQARLIGAHEDSDSYLDYYHTHRNVVGALVSWDVTPSFKATAGYSYQRNVANGAMWGALPLSYADASQISYPRSASTAAPWTYWNTRNQNAFAEVRDDLGGDWSIKGVYTFNRIQYDAKLLYAYGYPDPATGEDVAGIAGLYPATYNQNFGDLYAAGPLHLLGRQHDVAFGVSYGHSIGHEYEGDPISGDEIDYPSISQLGHVTIPEPDFGTPELEARLVDRLTRAYGSVRWNITDQLKAITGFSATWLRSTGSSYGVDEARKNSKVTPYLGALYTPIHSITFYADYTGIFDPQTQVDVTNKRLAPATGASIEGGIKTQWLHDRLYATAALFRAKQKNLAEDAGTFGDDGPGPAGSNYYVGQTTISKGYELEIAGRITPQWTVGGGYTSFSLRAPGGARVFSYLPNRSFKLNTSYMVPRLRNLTVGADVRWQDATHITDSGVQDAAGNDAVIRQSRYAVMDLTAGIDTVAHVRAQINVRNVTNTKYLNSLAFGQAYYAEPRTVMGSLSFTY